MIRRVIVDSGPLTAFFDSDDARHRWVIEKFQKFESPLLTVEPVLTEVMFLLKRHANAQDKLMHWVAKGALRIPFQLQDEAEAVRVLRSKYRDLPMSLADACLVRLAEIRDDHSICTLDSDFMVYRKHGRAPIPLIKPE